MSLNETISNLGDSIINLVDKKRRGTLGLEQGKVGYDKEVWSDIYKYKHSTFDINKFTVVGSPNVTEDGVASEFSTSNYITKSTSGINFTKPFKITQLIDTSNVPIHSTLGMFNVSGWTLGFRTTNNYTIEFYLSVGSKETIVKNLAANVINGKCYVTLEWTGSTYILETYDINGNQLGRDTYTSSEPMYKASNITAYYIGRQYGSNYSPFINGSIDLSHFSINVDGKEVFSGNKTGLDVIKEDNYTVVGNPTITEDGILEPLFVENSKTLSCVQTTGFKLGQLLNKRYKIEGSFILEFPTDRSSAGLFSFGQTTPWISWSNSFWINPNYLTIQGRFGTDSDPTDNITPAEIPKTYLLNYIGKKITYLVEFDGIDTYTYKLLDSNGIEIFSTQYVPTSEDKNLYGVNVYPQETINIGDGHQAWGISYASVLKIDLNSFKVYVDDQLVYQPCLKIPYTESKTGSKIANEGYRDRVIDMYEQEGYAGYYTIQENKKDNYAVIGAPTIVDGILTQYNYTQALDTGINLSNYDSWKIELPFIFDARNNDWTSLLNTLGRNSIYIWNVFTDGGFRWALIGNDGNAIMRNSSNSTTTYIAATTGDNMCCEVEFTGSQYSVDIKNLTKNTQITQTTSSSTKIKSGSLLIGYGASDSGKTCYHKIDLNAFKIYADGKLVYRAFTPPNYTLPMGDVYGVLSAKTNSSEISKYGMPSKTFEALTLGASGATYTAPANGWFIFSKVAGAVDKYINLSNLSNNMREDSKGTLVTDVLSVYLPVKKGDSIKAGYNATGDLYQFGFIYAEGEKQ